MSTSGTDSTTVADTEAPPRQDLIETAVKFMQNPNVVKTTLGEQQRFLRRKGLTDPEIHLACEKSGAYERYRNTTNQPSNLALPSSTTDLLPYNNQLTVFNKFREFLHNVAVFGFVAYVIYKFYERFIEPFLFGRRKKSVEESVEDLTTTMKTAIDDLNTNMMSVRIEIDKLAQGGDIGTQRQLVDLKTEVSTVKGLLLCRSQFPSVSKSITSIPDWQKISHDSDADSDPERKVEDLLDACSGSGSEHCTKNSDSSLEIISYSSKDSDFHRRRSKDDEEDDENPNEIKEA